MNPISICIIAKNEERTLDKCLSALKPIDCEIIFVDTGSTDSTKQIAKKYTDKIYDFTWTDDFSAARNFSISKASHDWILVIDCDEYVENFDMQQLLAFTHSNKESIGEITRHDLYGSSTDNYTYTSLIERFFNKKYFHYSLPIHEQIVPVSRCEYQTLPVPVSILHDGYFDNEERLKAKNERNIRILEQALKNNPNDAYLNFQTGQSYYGLEQYEIALSYYQKALAQDINFTSVAGRSLVNGWINCLNELHRSEEALQILVHYHELCDTSDFLLLMGHVYTNLGRYVEAVGEYLKAIQAPKCNKEGANSYLPYYRIGILYEALGDIRTAAVMFQKCGDYAPAQKKLKELLI